MKLALAFCAFVFLSSSLRANYENQAIDRALDSHFSSVQSQSSVNYTETDRPFCELEADFWVEATRYGSRQSEFYDCFVCLNRDDNHLWEYESIECDFATH